MTQDRPTHRAVVIADVVQQHASEAAGLWTSRTRLAAAPRGSLFELQRMDGRLAAHLDGLSVAADEGWRFCEAALEDRSPGAVFVAAAVAIEAQQQERLDSLFALAPSLPEVRAGLTSASGWVEPAQLRGIVARLLKSDDPFKRTVGVSACAMHGVDPGLTTVGWFTDPSPPVRARALRAAGEIGCVNAREACTAAMADQGPGCQFWAAWSAVLLGDRNRGLNALAGAALADGPHRPRAFALALQAMEPGAAHGALRQLAADPAQLRWLIQGSGVVGDPAYVPWLIGHMAKSETARLAGEAFALTTGADLEKLQLDRPRPDVAEAGPNENPDDENVEMDPDEGLPWPDPERVQRWWDDEAGRFAAGTRVFMGAPATPGHCLAVLTSGCQRQRVLAAQYLSLLNPGTPLFGTRAPAWRQQRLLAQME